MRKTLFAAVAITALCGMASIHQASAAPVQPGLHATTTTTATDSPIVKADWYWRHEHWRHRRWEHHHWYYYR
jgi:hypothetical protein